MASTQLTVRIDPSSKRPAIPSNKVGPDGSCLSFGVADSPVVKLAACTYTNRRSVYRRHSHVCSYIGLRRGSSDAPVRSRFIGPLLMPSRSLPHTPMSVRNSLYLFTLTFRRSELSVYTIVFQHFFFYANANRDVSRFYYLRNFGDPVPSPVFYRFINLDLWKFQLAGHHYSPTPYVYTFSTYLCKLFAIYFSIRASHLKRFAPEA